MTGDKGKKQRWAGALLLAAALLAGPAWARARTETPAGSFEERIRAVYEKITDLTGRFRQESRIRELGETQEAEGRFFIRRPGRLRWDYLKPERQRIVIRGDRMFVRQGDDEEVLEGRFDTGAYGRTPMALLAGLGDLRRDFTVKAVDPKTLLLLPKGEMGIIRSIRLEASDGPFPVRGLQVVDVYGNVNRFVFDEVRINTGLKDEVFVP